MPAAARPQWTHIIERRGEDPAPATLHRKCANSLQSTLPIGKFPRRNQHNREDDRASFSVQFIAKPD